MDLVRWTRKGRATLTKLHADAYSAHDTEGRTHCGLVYDRKRAEYHTADDGTYCQNCRRAVRIIPRRTDHAESNPEGPVREAGEGSGAGEEGERQEGVVLEGETG